MGAIYKTMVLRQSPQFRDFIHAGIIAVADVIIKEAPTVQYHAARVAMANTLIKSDEPMASSFVDRMVYRGTLAPSIRDAMFTVDTEILDLRAPADATITNSIGAVWNDVALYVWPTIIEDTANPA